MKFLQISLQQRPKLYSLLCSFLQSFISPALDQQYQLNFYYQDVGQVYHNSKYYQVIEDSEEDIAKLRAVLRALESAQEYCARRRKSTREFLATK